MKRYESTEVLKKKIRNSIIELIIRLACTFVYGALMLCFALMQIDFAAVLLLVFSYLFVEGYAVYCRIQIEKEI